LEEPKNRYINSLDGLRALGISLVILYHFLRLRGYHSSVVGFAWISIQMFFVQSGYLITNILVNNKSLPLKKFLSGFYRNRILRIFPVYLLYVLLLTTLFILVGSPFDFLKRLPFLITHTYNFTRFVSEIDFNPLYVHLWSLAVEEQFYLVWPFFIYFLTLPQIKKLILFLLVLSPAVRLLLGNYLAEHTSYDEVRIGEIVYGFTLSHFDSFAIGGAIAVFDLRYLKKRIHLFVIGFLLVLTLVVITNQLGFLRNGINSHWTSLGLPIGELHHYQHVWSYTLVNLLFALLTLMIIDHQYNGFFNWPPIVFIGKFAYGTYIFHFFIIAVIVRVIPNGWNPILFALCYLFSNLAGYLSYTFFEKRFLQYKYRNPDGLTTEKV